MATASSLKGSARANAFDAIAAGTTDSALVAAVTGKRIRVHSVVINEGDTTASTVTFNTKPAGAGSAVFCPLKAAANGVLILPYNDAGWFQTNVSEGLSVTTGAGSISNVAVTFSTVT